MANLERMSGAFSEHIRRLASSADYDDRLTYVSLSEILETGKYNVTSTPIAPGKRMPQVIDIVSTSPVGMQTVSIASPGTTERETEEAKRMMRSQVIRFLGWQNIRGSYIDDALPTLEQEGIHVITVLHLAPGSDETSQLELVYPEPFVKLTGSDKSAVALSTHLYRFATR